MIHATPDRPARRVGLALMGLIVAITGFGGCGRKAAMVVAPLPTQTLAPDFSIQDVNPNSTTHGLNVSPRDQLGKISAWYFGHAT